MQDLNDDGDFDDAEPGEIEPPGSVTTVRAEIRSNSSGQLGIATDAKVYLY